MKEDIEELKDNILFQIDMQLYNEFNDKFCEINEHLGDIYTYKDLEDIKEAETEKERKLLREAIKNLINRVKKLEKEEKELEHLLTSQLGFNLYRDYIPKSKIKEKIEKYHHKDFIKLQVCYKHDEEALKIVGALQELLEEQEDK